jgi:hypothetical protein
MANSFALDLRQCATTSSSSSPSSSSSSSCLCSNADAIVANRKRVSAQHTSSLFPIRLHTRLLKQRLSHSNGFGKKPAQCRVIQVKALAPDDGAGDTNKVPLWRKELTTSDKSVAGTESSFADEFLQSATMEEDIVRLKKKRDVEKRMEKFQRSSRDSSLEEKEDNGFAKTAIEKLLVGDFFFILFILAWLVAGVGEKAALKTSTLIDSWLPLWPTIFQPALGIFMAGALVSALSGYLSKKEEK